MFRVLFLTIILAANAVGCSDPNAEETTEEQQAMEEQMENLPDLLPVDLPK